VKITIGCWRQASPASSPAWRRLADLVGARRGHTRGSRPARGGSASDEGARKAIPVMAMAALDSWIACALHVVTTSASHVGRCAALSLGDRPGAGRDRMRRREFDRCRSAGPGSVADLRSWSRGDRLPSAEPPRGPAAWPMTGVPGWAWAAAVGVICCLLAIDLLASRRRAGMSREVLASAAWVGAGLGSSGAGSSRASRRCARSPRTRRSSRPTATGGTADTATYSGAKNGQSSVESGRGSERRPARQTPGEPARRRNAVRESDRPTSWQNARSTS
jgi:hypothetical protein